MPPFNRFTPSKYKNQLLEPHKPQTQFTELPSIVPSTNGRTISCGNQFLAISLGPHPWGAGADCRDVDWVA